MLVKTSDGNDGLVYANPTLYTISASQVTIFGQFPVDLENGVYAMTLTAITDEDAVSINVITGE